MKFLGVVACVLFVGLASACTQFDQTSYTVETASVETLVINSTTDGQVEITKDSTSGKIEVTITLFGPEGWWGRIVTSNNNNNKAMFLSLNHENTTVPEDSAASGISFNFKFVAALFAGVFFLGFADRRIAFAAFVAIAIPVALSQMAMCNDFRVAVQIKTPANFTFTTTSLNGPITFAITDPAPAVKEGGIYGCTGCPTTTYSGSYDITTSDTVKTFSGSIAGATGDGTWYLETIPKGGRQSGLATQVAAGTITSTSGGGYSYVVPFFCGQQILKQVWYNGSGRLVFALDVVTEDCVTSDIRATLSWNQIGNDWDLHLLRPPNGCFNTANDCYYANRNPNWGNVSSSLDDPKLDVDCISSCALENIFLAQPENGIYKILAYHYGGNNNIQGQVVVNVVGRSPAMIPINTLPYRGAKLAATVEWPSGRITTYGTVYDTTCV